MQILYSETGSSGNFSFITDGKTNLIIDVGLPFDKCNRLSNYKIPFVSGILITHKHTDHTKYLKDFLKLFKPTYAPLELWEKQKDNLGVYKRYCKTINQAEQIIIGTFIIKPFKLPHYNSDGSECENYGFLIYSTVTKEKMLWATDCHYINAKFPPLDYICIECNRVDTDEYTQDELSYIDNVVVEKRRLNSHLSLRWCIDFLEKQDLSRIKQIRLLHLSKNQGKIDDIIYNTFKSNNILKEIEVKL